MTATSTTGRIDDHAERMRLADRENEGTLLGSLLVDLDRFDEVDGLATRGDFARPMHATIWQGMEIAHATGETLNEDRIVAECVKLNGTHPDALKLAVGELKLGRLQNQDLPAFARRVADARRRRDRLVQLDAARRALVDDSPVADDLIEGLVDTRTEVEAFAPIPLDIDKVLTEPIAPIPWIYRPWFAEGDRVLIAADGGVGKSALSLDLALAMSSGADWLGARNHTGPRRIVFLDEEMPEQLGRRRIQLAAIQRTIDPTRLHYFCEAGFNLDDGATHAALETELAWAGQERGFVILDALIRFHRRNENDAMEMGALFMSILRPMLKKHGVGLITNHHEAKNQFGQAGGRSGQQKARGSTDIPNFHDVTISYERDPTDRDKRVLRLNKSRWWMSAEETQVEGIANDNGDLVALQAVEVGNEVKAFVQRKLAVVGDAGILRADIEADWMEEHEGMTKDTAQRAVGRALNQLDAARRRDGKNMRYWLRNHAPEDAK